ncbi:MULTISPECIES: hypothetical protein [Klebsiella]|uniref:hypothetical protein n=1 Tax=Klebsiella TaxID=570 RepID=UPI00115EEEEB|nr:MULTISPECIES: hypothetical protein [Klebsiella]HCB0628653.1 hypothetical protein [Klebsiella variicola subsp. variicola]MBD0721877.1 hypothetical protein [Klebsiella variicola]HBX8166099.1 hypothetical protein [Klebsiella pneumoniae]HCU1304097.1 hypothetical protein [Klebsiella pneumoniae]HDH0086904.1 hypothetical protein [Klebsiella pneumoniae]
MVFSLWRSVCVMDAGCGKHTAGVTISASSGLIKLDIRREKFQDVAVHYPHYFIFRITFEILFAILEMSELVLYLIFFMRNQVAELAS